MNFSTCRLILFSQSVTRSSLSLVMVFLMLLFGLTGCVSLGGDTPVVPNLLTLTLVDKSEGDAVIAPQGRDGNGRLMPNPRPIVIETFSVPSYLRSSHIPVRTREVEIYYITDIFWADRPNRLFHELLREQVEATGDFQTFTAPQALAGGQKAITRVNGQIKEFGVVVGEDSIFRDIVITIDVVVTKPDNILEKKRFSVRAPIEKVDAKRVPSAINNAANNIAQQISMWLSE